MTSLTDLVRKYQAAEPHQEAACFSEIIEEIGPCLQRYVFLHCHFDIEAAKDVSQEVFVAIFLRLKTLRLASDDELRAYLFGIARNKVKDYWKRQQRVPMAMDPEVILRIAEAAEQDQPESYKYVDEFEDCIPWLQSLDPKDFQLLIDHYFVGLSVKEIAQLEGLRENTVSQRLRRCRERAKTLLEKGL